MKRAKKSHNFYDKLTEAEKKIWFLIYYHPTFICNRASALDLLFCVIGTGLEWESGEIKDNHSDNYLTSKKRERRSFDSELYKRAYVNTFSRGKDDFKKPDIEFLKSYSLHENAKALWVQENIENLVTLPTPQKSFYPLSEYSNLMCVPKNVKKDWLKLAIETCDLILLCDPNYQTPGGRMGNIQNIKLVKKQRVLLKKIRVRHNN